jgi:hypothetical protein
MSLTPPLPRPEWVNDIISKLAAIPEVTQVQRALAVEQENLRRVRKQRDMLVDDMKKLQLLLTERNNKIAELEALIIERLRQKM